MIDEAYVDFGAESAIPLIARYPNLLVTHTLSKSRALAGLRVGVAFGQRDLIDALERVKDSFNSYPLDRLAQAGATAAYEDEDWFRQSCARVIASRERLTAELTQLGFDVLPSKANFIFASHPAHKAADIFKALRERDHRALVRQAAHFRALAHFHRHGRRMRPAGGGAEGDFAVERAGMTPTRPSPAPREGEQTRSVRPLADHE